MTWTSQYPTRPGYYWVRNYQLSQWDEFTAEPHVAELFISLSGNMLCYFTYCGDFFTDCDIVGGEWFGPITPPEPLSDDISPG